MNPSTTCTTRPLAQPAQGFWLARLLRRSARTGGRYLLALWNLRLGRRTAKARRLSLSEMNEHMLRDIHGRDGFDLWRELDRYEQIKAGLPLSRR